MSHDDWQIDHRLRILQIQHRVCHMPKQKSIYSLEFPPSGQDSLSQSLLPEFTLTLVAPMQPLHQAGAWPVGHRGEWKQVRRQRTRSGGNREWVSPEPDRVQVRRRMRHLTKVANITSNISSGDSLKQFTMRPLPTSATNIITKQM